MTERIYRLSLPCGSAGVQENNSTVHPSIKKFKTNNCKTHSPEQLKGMINLLNMNYFWKCLQLCDCFGLAKVFSEVDLDFLQSVDMYFRRCFHQSNLFCSQCQFDHQFILDSGSDIVKGSADSDKYLSSDVGNSLVMSFFRFLIYNFVFWELFLQTVMYDEWHEAFSYMAYMLRLRELSVCNSSIVRSSHIGHVLRCCAIGMLLVQANVFFDLY